MNYKNLNNADEIKKMFLKLNPIPKGNVFKPYLILFDGITGTGKSTVAKIISEKTDIVVLNNDKVRQFIYRTNFSNDWEDIQKLVKKIQYYRIENTLKNNNNCLLDCNMSNNFETKISMIKQFNFNYYIIKLIYDREKVIKRINNRKIDKDALNSFNASDTLNYSNADINDFLRMEKEKYNIPEEYIYFEIDTSKDINYIEKQVDEFIKKICK